MWASGTSGSGALYSKQTPLVKQHTEVKPKGLGHRPCMFISVCVCVFTPKALLFTLCPSERDIWGCACSRQHLRSSNSASPSGCLRRHTNATAVDQTGPLHGAFTTPQQGRFRKFSCSTCSQVISLIKATLIFKIKITLIISSTTIMTVGIIIHLYC